MEDETMTITINHERYGISSEFASIQEAQATVRDCGQEFAGVTLYEDCGRIYDERGEIVGSVSEEAANVTN
jgi:hypothetical protein